jgi:hypothetical protein
MGIDDAIRSCNFQKLLGDLIALELERYRTLAHRRVLRLQQSFFNKLEQPRDTRHRRCMVMAELGELRLGAVRLGRRRLDVGVEHGREPVRIEDLPRNLAHYDLVELLHRSAQTATGRRPFLHFLNSRSFLQNGLSAVDYSWAGRGELGCVRSGGRSCSRRRG